MQMRTNPQDTARTSELLVILRSISLPKLLVLAVIILFSISAVTLFNDRRAAAVTNQPTDGLQPGSMNSDSFPASTDYSKFSHSKPREHAGLMGSSNCVSCHRRSDSSPVPRFPVHKDCTGCHLVEFTAATSSDNPICTICHTKEGINLPTPPLRNFSALRSFNAQFDHAQHMEGIEAARPQNGCVDCHTLAVRGIVETIPARLNAHGGCYKCHSPGGRASNSSSCGDCHKLGISYTPTPTAARAYRVGFSHAKHGPRQGLSCESCHNIVGRNLPQAKQVSSIFTMEHRPISRTPSCMTCHNDKRAFGDKGPNFDVCKRCHKGPKFVT
jgi:c(7)-type cytochrome triheme protein